MDILQRVLLKVMKKWYLSTESKAIGSNWAAGDIMYEDTNNDKQVTIIARTITDHGDLKVIGDSTPRFCEIDLKKAGKASTNLFSRCNEARCMVRNVGFFGILFWSY